MEQRIIYILTFIIYFIAIIMTSIIANQRTKGLSDYVLGNRSLSGPIAALGAGASDMGGWLLLALPGAVFVHGLNQIWMPIGLLIGAYLNWRFVAVRLRTYTEVANDALTIPEYFDNRFHDQATTLRFITALVVLIFFTFYAAANFVSGALLFQTAFHLKYLTALICSSALIISYIVIGGFLAVNWIDFFQGSLMFCALIIAPIMTFHHIGSWHITHQILEKFGPSYMHAFTDLNWIAVASLLSWGLGYFGQPHILVRFMAAKSNAVLPQARRICMSWMVISLIGSIATGLIGHAYFHHGLAKPESVFLQIAEYLFNPWMAGLLLAAVLSAVMSTTAAQLLAASSALTADFYQRFLRKNPKQKELVFVSRFTVLLVGVVAAFLAANPNSNILQLVAYAWAGLGASFGPVILISLSWKRMTRLGAIYGIITGALVVIGWKMFLTPYGGIFNLYEILPGFIANTIVIYVVSMLDKAPAADIIAEFKKTLSLIKEH